MSLLADADPRVVSMCRSQVLSWGGAALPVLSRASEASDPRLRVRARELLKTLGLRGWIERVQRFARAPESHASSHFRVLEAGALLLSSVDRPEPVDRAPMIALLDRRADDLRSRFRGRTAGSCARFLGHYMGAELGFAGDGVSQYSMDSVALDSVLEKRRGVSVALSIAYLLVGRRAGLKMSGVAMPDHYLVRVHAGRPVLLDPVRGDTVTKGECTRYLRVLGYSGAASVHLQDLDDRDVLLGLLGSLQLVFGYREDGETLRALRRAKELLTRA